MNKELELYVSQLNENFSGEPWFGRSIQSITGEIDEKLVSQKPGGQHSILELLYHMINWRLFTINQFEKNQSLSAKHYEENDWQVLDHNDNSLWKKGLQMLEETQQTLVKLLKQMTDEKLSDPVAERNYNYRSLINGIIQHDIYHLGQIAYIKKMLS